MGSIEWIPVDAACQPTDAKPWHETPACPVESCRCPSAPIREAHNGHGGPEGSSLFCVGCGDGWVGTAEEVAQAERAQAAWELHCNELRR